MRETCLLLIARTRSLHHFIIRAIINTVNTLCDSRLKVFPIDTYIKSVLYMIQWFSLFVTFKEDLSQFGHSDRHNCITVFFVGVD